MKNYGLNNMREGGFHKCFETANICCINLNRSEDEKKIPRSSISLIFNQRLLQSSIYIYIRMRSYLFLKHTVHRRFPRDANDVCSVFSLNLLCKLSAIKIKLQLLVLACTKAMHILTNLSEIKL